MEVSLKTKNGINVYAYKNPDLHSFHLSLFLRAGAMFESAAESGMESPAQTVQPEMTWHT